MSAPFSPRRHPFPFAHRRISVSVVVCLLLGVGICGCLYVMILIHSKITLSMGSNPLKMRTSLGQTKNLEEGKTLKDGSEHITNLAAVKRSHAWILQKFHPPEQMTSSRNFKPESNTQPEEEEQQHVVRGESKEPSDIFQRPQWLTMDAQKLVVSSTKYDQDDGQEEEDWMPCRPFNRTVYRPTHGCQVNPDTRQIFCNFVNLRIDTSHIQVDQGGEPLETVMGRLEVNEFPQYSKGAFTVRRRPEYEESMERRAKMLYMKDVLHNLVYITDETDNGDDIHSHCVETRPGTTLMITRYEYANLYHSLTDWWNTFTVLTPEQVQRKEKVNILFLDGHAEGNLDPVWEDIFGRYEHVKHLPAGGVCFERAVFIPAGYSSPLFPSDEGRQCPKKELARAFSDFVVKTYGLQDIHPIPGKVVIIDRQPYVSHPRSIAKKFRRKMNLEDLVERLRSDSKVTSVDIIRFETLPYAEQLRTVRQAHVLIGNHGAGISNLLFMDERTSHVLEFDESLHDFFIDLAEWKDIDLQSMGVDHEDHLSDIEISNAVSWVNRMIQE